MIIIMNASGACDQKGEFNSNTVTRHVSVSITSGGTNFQIVNLTTLRIQTTKRREDFSSKETHVLDRQGSGRSASEESDEPLQVELTHPEWHCKVEDLVIHYI